MEWYNRVILQFIRCFLEGKQKDWDRYIHVLRMALCAAVNRSMGFTANILLFGSEVNMPVDLFHGWAEANHKEQEPAEYLRDLLKTTKETCEMVQKNLRASQVRQK